jgi:hypothetical protein
MEQQWDVAEAAEDSEKFLSQPVAAWHESS